MRHHQLALLLSLATATPLSAQRIDDARVAVHQPPTELPSSHHSSAVSVAPRTSSSTGAMVAGGLIGGVLGTFAGVAVGISAENCRHGVEDDMCGVAGGVIGGLIGEAIGVPIGVNWAANGRGTLTTTIPMSASLTAVCMVAGFATYGGSMLALVPLQIYTSIRAERNGKSGFLFW
jgi:hypothetical protein